MTEGIFAHWPNRITMMRFLGSLVLFFILSVWGDALDRDAFYSGLCFWLFIAIAATDYLDGYLARRGNLITSFGRNISPEWPESLLLENPSIAQAAVFGDARPYLVAVLVASPQTEHSALDRAVRHANTKLPEYARVAGWVRASAPFTALNGLATANGRIRRDALQAQYASRLNALYEPAHRAFAMEDLADAPSSLKRYS